MPKATPKAPGGPERKIEKKAAACADSEGDHPEDRAPPAPGAGEKKAIEKVVEGPSKELADRARVHLRIATQRMNPPSEQNPRSAEELYQRGVAMMNIGRWDDAREALVKARKAAPKADHIHYALASLDCLTGEADSAMANPRDKDCAGPAAAAGVGRADVTLSPFPDVPTPLL